MKAYLIEILIIDHDNLGPDEIKDVIENCRFPNWCIAPTVKNVVEKDIGEWTDDHPLNLNATCDAAFERIFRSVPAV